MSSRRDETWLNRLKATGDAIDQQQTTQQMGNGVLISYKTSSTALYDYNFTLTNTVPERMFRLVFTHDKAQDGALLDLKVFTSVDNTDVMANAIPYYVSVMPPALVRYKKDLAFTTGTQTAWKLVVAKGSLGVPSFEIYWKFFIDGTDKGTWSVTAL